MLCNFPLLAIVNIVCLFTFDVEITHIVYVRVYKVHTLWYNEAELYHKAVKRIIALFADKKSQKTTQLNLTDLRWNLVEIVYYNSYWIALFKL